MFQHPTLLCVEWHWFYKNPTSGYILLSYYWRLCSLNSTPTGLDSSRKDLEFLEFYYQVDIFVFYMGRNLPVMRSGLIWDITRCIEVIHYRIFGTTHRPIGPIFKDEESTDRLSRSVGKNLPLYIVYNLRRAQISPDSWRKPENTHSVCNVSHPPVVLIVISKCIILFLEFLCGTC